MADFRAQLDARRLLKKLTASPARGDGSSSHQYETTPRRDLTTQASGHTDTLKKKYEELGRLLALQHLEQNVLSSVGSLDVHLASSRKSRHKISKSSSQGSARSSKKLKNKSSASRKRTAEDEHIQTPGYMFVRIPQVIAEETLVEERLSPPVRSSKLRPKSGRAKPSQSDRRSTRSSHKTKYTTDQSEHLLDNSSSFGSVPSREYSNGEDSDLSASGRYHTSPRYIDKNGIIQFEEHHNFEGEDVIFDSVSENEELLFEERRTNEPLFVIEGEVELTETVTYQSPTKTEKAEIVDITEDNQSRQFHHSETGIPVGKSKKRVSFCENSDEEMMSGRRDDAEIQKDDFEARIPKGDLSSLHVVLENEILNELLLSPRPGLYQQSCNDKKEAKVSHNRKKKRKVKRKTKSEDDEVIKSTDSTESRESLGNSQNSPRVSDCKLERTDNPAIRLWLRRKNKLIRKQKRAERQKEKNEEIAEQKQREEKVEKLLKSEETVAEWKENKKKETKERLKMEKNLRKAMKKQEEERKRVNNEKDLRTENRSPIHGSCGDKSQVAGKKKVKRKKIKKSKVHPGKVEENVENNVQIVNHQKRVSYDEWLSRKRTDAKKLRLKQESLASDPDLDQIIPSLGKERIKRATRIRGRRLQAVDEKREELDQSDLPESDQSDLPESDQQYENPFKLPGGDGDGWIKSLGSKPKRPVSARKPSQTTIKGVGKENPRKGSPVTEKQVITSRSVAQGSNQNQRYAWEGNDGLVQDSGCETLNSDHSTHGCHGNLTDSKSDKDEGIFLTDSV